MEVDGTFVNRRERTFALRCPEDRPGVLVDDDESLRVAGAEREPRGRSVPSAPDVPRRRRLELGQDGGSRKRLGPEDLGIRGNQRTLVRRRQHVPVEDPRHRRVDQRSLDAAAEECARLGDEELVECVLARDQHCEPARPTACPSPLLPQRGDRARKADRDGAVERSDVDAQLERVGGRHAEQLALDEPPLDLAALPRRVARAVGRQPAGDGRIQAVGREAVDELGGLAALGEADRPEPAVDELREQPRRIAERARANPQVGVDELGVPERDLACRRRGRVDGDRHHVEPGQSRRELVCVGDRGRREHEDGLRTVCEREPSQAPEDVRHVGAEYAAVDMRLVHHDQPQVVQHVAPAVVVGEDADVQHVRVRQHDVRGAANVRAPLDRRVAVVDRRPQPAEPERREPPGLVLRERLRGIEEEGPGRGIACDRVEHREREAERLARRRSGRQDDMPAAGGRLPGPCLVRVEARDASAFQRRGDVRVEIDRERLLTPRARRLHGAVRHLRGVEQVVPGREDGQSRGPASARSRRVHIRHASSSTIAASSTPDRQTSSALATASA